jgi:LacI family transcriptional regulator
MTDTPHKRSTRADVARLAGVSVATVSFALNNDPRISAATTRKVIEAARQLDYRPNALAQSLQSGVTHTLGLVMPDMSNPYFGQLAENLEKVAARRGYTLLVNLSHGDAQLERRRIDELFNRQVDAIFISSAQSDAALARLSRIGRHVVLLDRGQPIGHLHSVTSDLRQAAFDATAHLIGHHRRHIALLSGSTNVKDPRVVGWKQAQQEAGINPGLFVSAGFTADSSYEATSQMLDDTAVDAIFASSDLVGLGALRALREHHLDVPHDVAMVSLDGTFVSRFVSPSLTVIEQNTEEIARYAVSAALDADAPLTHIVPTRLVVRESCGCVAQ